MAKKQKVPRKGQNLQTTLGMAVKNYRQKLGITQEELAWRADMHRTYLADIERGARNVTLRSIENLARALQLSVEGLFVHARWAGALPDATLAPGEVLLVEDNPADVDLTLRAFRHARFGNSVTVVRDGAEALEYFFRTGAHAKRAGGQPQLVLLDLELPKVSGIDVLRRIRSRAETKTIPVVVLTVSRQDANIMECGRLGVANYIVKPIDFGSFAQAAAELNFRWTLSPSPGAAYQSDA